MTDLSVSQNVLLYDGTGSLLRKLHGHKGTVYSVKFAATKTEVISGGADKLVRVWDLATEQNIISFAGHEDYIRALANSPTTPNLWLSGGYDSKVRPTTHI